MMDLVVTLLNEAKVERNNERISFPYRKAEGLFYYLCLHPEITREEAIGIFWADNDEKSARKNLRDAIYNIRKVLDNDIISVEGYTKISLNTGRIYRMDLQQINDENILEQYPGDFLNHFYIRNCLEFETWVQNTQNEWKKRYVQAIMHSLSHIKKGAEQKELDRCSELLLVNHIWEEEIFRQVMSRYAEIGRYNQALKVYQKLVTALWEDLDADVEIPTQKLADTIHRTKNHIKSLPSDAKEYFYGRTDVIYDFISVLQSEEDVVRSFFIVGEAGVGKSSLLRRMQMILDEEECISFFWKCLEYEQELLMKPWNPILTQIQDHCSKAGIAMPTWVLPSYQPGEDMKFYLTRFDRMAEEILRYLLKAFPEKKIVLFIDDIQWMDIDSRKMLTNLMQRVGRKRFVVYMTCLEGYTEKLNEYRSRLERYGLARELELYRFTREETFNIVQQRRPDLLKDGKLADQIYEQTQGNALFIMEWLKCIPENGSYRLETWVHQISSVLTQRFAALTKGEQEFLSYLSMFREPVNTMDLCKIFHMEITELLRAVESLCNMKVIEEIMISNEICYRFNYRIMREFTYANIAEGRRRIMHEQIATYLEGKFQEYQDYNLYAALIYHYEAGQNDYRAYWYKIEYLRVFYSIRHEKYPIVSDNLEIDSLRENSQTKEENLANLAEEIRGLRPVNRQTEDLRMRMEYVLGRYRVFCGDYSVGLPAIEKSIELARKYGDRNYLFRNYLQMVFYGIQTAQYDIVDTYTGKADRILQDEPYDPEKSCVIARLNGLYMLNVGRHEEGITILENTIEQLQIVCDPNSSYRQGIAVCYNYLGEEALKYKEYHKARDYFMQALTAATRPYMINGKGVFYTNLARIEYELGNMKEARTFINQAIPCFQISRSILSYARAESYAALIDIKEGNLIDAVKHCQTAREKARQMGDPHSLEIVNDVQRQIEIHT